MSELYREQVTTIPAGYSGPRVALFGCWNDAYAPLAEIARPNWAAYCERHGYSLTMYPRAFHLDPSRPETFGDKVRFSLYHDLRGYADIVMSLDIDSLFMNMEPKIDDVLVREMRIEGFAYKHWPPTEPRFLWTYGDDGPLSGLWIARTDDVTEKHLRYAYERAAIENNVRHGKIEPNGISDQDSMTRLMNTPPFSATFGNCYPNTEVGFVHPDTYKNGDWIVTARGGSLESKLDMMREWAQKVAV